MSKCEKLSKKFDITECENVAQYKNRLSIVFSGKILYNHLEFKGKVVLVDPNAFTHLTTDGSSIKAERTLALDRCCRLSWVHDILGKNICNNCPKCLVWDSIEDGKKKVKFLCRAENYVIVLQNMGEHYILLTAFNAYSHVVKKLIEEYNRKKKCP